MSIVHIAFYPSDWLAGTRGLSAEETGVYITLVCRMYEMAGPIERDDDRLHRLCGAKSKKAFIKSLEYLISEGKIIESDGELFNERAQKEIEITTNKSSKAKTAAQSRWNRKSNKNNDRNNADASPKHMPQQCQSEPEPELVKGDTKVSPKKPRNVAAQFPENWMPNEKTIEWCISKQYDETQIGQMVEDCVNHHRGKGNTFKCFESAFRTWASHQIKFHGTPEQQRNKHVKSRSNQKQAGMAEDPALKQIARLAGLR